jgi:hypothetical protein
MIRMIARLNAVALNSAARPKMMLATPKATAVWPKARGRSWEPSTTAPSGSSKGGAATRYGHRDHPPQWRARAPDKVADSQHPAPRPPARRPSVKQTQTGNRPRIAHLSAATIGIVDAG